MAEMLQENETATSREQNEKKDKPNKKVELQVQTPRGLWNKKLPPKAELRPVYERTVKIQQIIDDARKVFKFVENDNKYVLFLGEKPLDPAQTIESYRLKDETLLVLSVQGGQCLMIDPEVSLETLKTELTDALAYAASVNLKTDISTLSANNLRFFVTFHNRAGDKFYAEFHCADYPVLPPTIEFVNETRTERGAKQFYPNVFHPNPCICMRYNRKAHGEMGGPHGEWRLIDWQLATPGGGPIDSLAMMVSDLHVKILDAPGRLT